MPLPTFDSILEALKATVSGMSFPTVDRISVALKNEINRNVDSDSWQDFGSCKSSLLQVLGSSEN